jgi:hypothetical protein
MEVSMHFCLTFPNEGKYIPINNHNSQAKNINLITDATMTHISALRSIIENLIRSSTFYTTVLYLQYIANSMAI